MKKQSRPKAKAQPGKVKDLKARNENAVKGGIAVNDTGYCGDLVARPKPKP